MFEEKRLEGLFSDLSPASRLLVVLFLVLLERSWGAWFDAFLAYCLLQLAELLKTMMEPGLLWELWGILLSILAHCNLQR
jgi:hypothetical protein